MRIEAQDVAVLEGARFAFIGVAHQIFVARKIARHERPFQAGREACAATTAQAETSPWYVGGALGLSHETNVYRLPEGIAPQTGTARSDQVTSATLLGGLDQPIGRQRLFGNVTVRQNRYSGNPQFNNTSYNGSLGLDCPDAADWRIPQVKLRIRRLDDQADGGTGTDYSIDADCPAAELTTEFCLPPGSYELSLTAVAQRLVSNPVDGGSARVWGAPSDQRQARVVTPAAVQRQVQAGQIVNLDVVVLGVAGRQLHGVSGGGLGAGAKPQAAQCGQQRRGKTKSGGTEKSVSG